MILFGAKDYCILTVGKKIPVKPLGCFKMNDVMKIVTSFTISYTVKR